MHKDPKMRLPINVALRHKWFTMKLDNLAKSQMEYPELERERIKRDIKKKEALDKPSVNEVPEKLEKNRRLLDYRNQKGGEGDNTPLRSKDRGKIVQDILDKSGKSSRKLSS